MGAEKFFFTTSRTNNENEDEQDLFPIISLVSNANTSNLIEIETSDVIDRFIPTDTTWAYYKLETNLSDYFENFINGVNIGSFTFTIFDNLNMSYFNGTNQSFNTDSTESGFPSRGLYGGSGTNDNTVGLWFAFDELPEDDVFLWFAGDADEISYSALKYNALDSTVEYIRFQNNEYVFNINNVIDEYTITYNGTIAEIGDTFVYNGDTYDVVGVEPNVIYFLPELVGYTGDAAPFIGTQFTLIKEINVYDESFDESFESNNFVSIKSTTEFVEDTVYSVYIRYVHSTGKTDLFVNGQLESTITQIFPVVITDIDEPIKLGQSDTYGFVQMYVSNFRIAATALSDQEIFNLSAITKLSIVLFDGVDDIIIPTEWIVIFNNDIIAFTIPPDFDTGSYVLRFIYGGVSSQSINFNILPIPLRTTVLDEDFSDYNDFITKWGVLNKSWGGENGGVIKENVYLDYYEGELVMVFESHGDDYSGTVQGVDRFGNPKFNLDDSPWTTRVGGVIVSKEYYGFGSYEIDAKLMRVLGVASSMWTFHYQEIYETDPRWDFYTKDVIDTTSTQPNLRSQFIFDNNVTSSSGLDTPTFSILDSGNTTYTTGVKGGTAIRYIGTTDWAFNISGVQTLTNFTNPYTLSLWVKVNTRAANNLIHTIISNGTSNDGAFGVQVFYGPDGPEFQLVGKVTGETIVGTNNPNIKEYGTWQHLSVITNPTSGKMKLYIDGILAQDVNIPSGSYTDSGWWRLIQTTPLSGSGAGSVTRNIEITDLRFISRAVNNLESRVMYGRPYFIGNPDFNGLGLRVSGNEEDGFYLVRNNEIDIEVPSHLGDDPVNLPSLLNGKFNTWRGELKNWEEPKTSLDYWEEYRDNYRPMGIDITDDEYHKFRFDWYHDRVEFYVDDVLIITNFNYQFGYDSYNIPDVASILTIGNWFPSGEVRWAGDNAEFDVEKMYVRNIKYTPFTDEINNHQVVVGETYIETVDWNFISANGLSKFIDLSDSQEYIDNDITIDRNTIGTYINSSGFVLTASANQSRLNHDPITNDFIGLLVEPQRTNKLTYSTYFDTNWVIESSRISRLYNQATAPDNTLTATRFTRDIAGTYSLRQILSGGTFTTNSTWTFSVWVKVETTQTVTLNISNRGNTSFTVNPGDNWKRLSITHTFSNIETFPDGSFVDINVSTLGVGQFHYLWGAQVELGNSTTSYIPTTTAEFTRLADIVTLPVPSWVYTVELDINDSVVPYPYNNPFQLPNGNIKSINFKREQTD